MTTGLWLPDLVAPSDPVISTRVLDAVFTPHATKHTLVTYTVQLQCNGGQNSSVTLLSDEANPPTVAHCSSSLVVVGAGDTVTVRNTMTTVVKPGDNVKLVTAGNGTAPVLSHQVEFQLL